MNRHFTASFDHPFQPMQRLHCPKQHKPRVFRAFRQYIEQPMHSIIQINVGGTSLMRSDEFPRARPIPRMAGRVAELRVGLCFTDPPLASVPSENTADQFASAHEWISPEEIGTDLPPVHRPVG